MVHASSNEQNTGKNGVRCAVRSILEETTEVLAENQWQDILGEVTPGLFPERSSLGERILDLTYGTGNFALQIAQTHPTVEVVSIATNADLIASVSRQAKAQRVTNLAFYTMDSLPFTNIPDGSFDLVNAGFLFALLKTEHWLPLLQECRRILRPGGIVRLTEPEWPITTSPSAERLARVICSTLKQTGRSFSPDGRQLGLIPVLGSLLRKASYQEIDKRAYVNDFSRGMPTHQRGCAMYLHLLLRIRAFLLSKNAITIKEFDRLYQQTGEEMSAPNFCVAWYVMTTWGSA